MHLTFEIFHSQHFHIIVIKVGLINTSRLIKSRNSLLLDLNISFKTAWGLIHDNQRHLSSTRLMRTVTSRLAKKVYGMRCEDCIKND